MKKLSFLAIFSFFLLLTKTNAQVGIGTTTPNASASLDVKATNKGLLIPRVSLTGTTDVITIPSPVTSLMVYNTATAGPATTAVTPGYYYWDGSWTRMVSSKGGAVNFADFFALMPSPDNGGPIPPGGYIEFPRSAIFNSIITPVSSSVFNLPDIGVYEITFHVSITEAAQLGIVLNGFLYAPSVVGRSTGTSQIGGTFLIATSISNTVIAVTNVGNTSITVTAPAGGPNPVSAHLVIKKLN